MRKLLYLVAIATAAVPAARAGSLDGRWDGTIKSSSGAEIPFRIDFAGEGRDLKVSLFNGDVPVTSASASLEGDKIEARFDHFLGKLAATVKAGKIEGKFSGRGGEGGGSPFRAVRHVASTASAKGVPSIDGLWEVSNDSPNGEKTWRLIVRQNGAEVRAAILRVDGDTGEYTGTYKDSKFVLSHFSGVRGASLWTITPQADGSLAIDQGRLVVAGRRPGQGEEAAPAAPRQAPVAGGRGERGGGGRSGVLVAWRPADARKKGLPEPSDFSKHTGIKDPNQVFKFSGEDINGRTLTNEDPRFKGKVVVAIVTGTWCPNCHDEAQYLVQLYDKYRDKGLEIVALDFEQIAQQETGYPRVKAFIEHYGVKYTYLLLGDPVELSVKVPQAENLNLWPTTFFIGRDGRVKRVHSGFAAPATGDFNRQLKEEFVSTIEKLLTEKNQASR